MSSARRAWSSSTQSAGPGRPLISPIFDLEYIIAIALDVGRSKDLQRIETLLETSTRPVEMEQLASILAKHAPSKPRQGEQTLLERWKKLKEMRNGGQ